MDILSNREISVLIWLTILGLYAFTKKDISDAFLNCIRALFQKKILIVFGVLITYTSAIVILLNYFSVWESSLLKITILWLIAAFSRIVRDLEKATVQNGYFKNLFKETFGVIIILEFIVSFYSFNLLWELVTLPILTIIIVTDVWVQNSKIYKQEDKIRIKHFSESVISIYILFVIANTIMNISETPSSLFNIHTFKEFISPIILSCSFIPFMYLFITYTSYESLFIGLEYRVPKRLVPITKLMLILIFRGDRFSLQRWQRTAHAFHIENIRDLWISMNKIRKINRAKKVFSNAHSQEKHPHLARKYLEGFNIIAGDYNPSNYKKNEWAASSNLIDLSEWENTAPNNIAYYLTGDETSIKSLKLVLNINDLKNHKNAESKYLAACKELLEKVLNKDLPENWIKQLEKLEGFNSSIKTIHVQLSKDYFIPKTNGYSLKLLITI